MIAQADKVVFLLSPNSATSVVCNHELDRARQAGKVIVPVLIREVEASSIPEDIAKLNFVFMRDEVEYERGLPGLLDVLSMDLTWVREHTRLNDLATAWERSDRRSGHLLRGTALTEAEAWRGAQPPLAAPPTALQQAFIDASRRAALRRQRLLTASLASGLIWATALAGIAYWQRQEALAQRIEATQQRDPGYTVF